MHFTILKYGKFHYIEVHKVSMLINIIDRYVDFLGYYTYRYNSRNYWISKSREYESREYE